MIQLSEFLAPRPEPLWKLAKQCGVDSVVAILDGGEQDQRMFSSVGHGASSWTGRHDDVPWGITAIRAYKELFTQHGFVISAIEDTAPMDKIRTGSPGRDQQIDNVIAQITAMGNLGIPVLCYNWMAISSWARTSVDTKGRGDCLVTGFRASEASGLPDLVDAGEITSSQMWSAFSYFLDAVLPVAEKAGVRLALHPDDPPVPVVRGVPRIMSSVDAFRSVLALSPSHSNAVTLCQGNFTLMTEDVPAVIREFGSRDSIAFVHFRDVRGTADDFVETFHDEGRTDMVACMQAYAEIGFSGPMRPDHVPTLHGELNDRPAYGTLGRLFALGYIRGLEQAAYR